MDKANIANPSILSSIDLPKARLSLDMVEIQQVAKLYSILIKVDQRLRKQKESQEPCKI